MENEKQVSISRVEFYSAVASIFVMIMLTNTATSSPSEAWVSSVLVILCLILALIYYHKWWKERRRLRSGDGTDADAA